MLTVDSDRMTSNVLNFHFYFKYNFLHMKLLCVHFIKEDVFVNELISGNLTFPPQQAVLIFNRG